MKKCIYDKHKHLHIEFVKEHVEKACIFNGVSAMTSTPPPSR